MFFLSINLKKVILSDTVKKCKKDWPFYTFFNCLITSHYLFRYTHKRNYPCRQYNYSTEKGGLSIKIRKSRTAILVMLAFLLVFVSQAYAAPDTAPVKSEIKLTETQKQSIAALEKDILKQKKAVISKYVEFGVLSEAKGKEIISRMEQRYQMMEQNGFVPRMDKPMHRHCH